MRRLLAVAIVVLAAVTIGLALTYRVPIIEWWHLGSERALLGAWTEVRDAGGGRWEVPANAQQVRFRGEIDGTSLDLFLDSSLAPTRECSRRAGELVLSFEDGTSETVAFRLAGETLLLTAEGTEARYRRLTDERAFRPWDPADPVIWSWPLESSRFEKLRDDVRGQNPGIDQMFDRIFDMEKYPVDLVPEPESTADPSDEASPLR